MNEKSSREKILRRIKEAVKEISPLPEGDSRLPAGEGADTVDLPTLFSQRLRQAGGEVTIVEGDGELRTALVEYLNGLKPRRVLLQAHLRGGDPGIVEAVETSGADLLEIERFDPGVSAEADAGVTSADFGIADTGTIGLFHLPGKGRSAALLPPVHIALLERSGLFADKAAFLQYCRREGVDLAGIPMTWVTGPSLTADIEKVLVRGAHGPRRLIVILHSGLTKKG